MIRKAVVTEMSERYSADKNILPKENEVKFGNTLTTHPDTRT